MKVTRDLRPCCESMSQLSTEGYVLTGLWTDEVVLNIWTSGGIVKHTSDKIHYCPYCGQKLEVLTLDP